MKNPLDFYVAVAAGVALSAASLPVLAAGALIGAPARSSYLYLTHRANPDVAANGATARRLDPYGPGGHVTKTYFAGGLASAQSADGSRRSGASRRLDVSNGE